MLTLATVFHKTYHSNKILRVLPQLLRTQNAMCLIKMSLFFFQDLCLFIFTPTFFHFHSMIL